MDTGKPEPADSIRDRAARRAAMAWSYWNGAIWAFGNGLCSSTLITFLAIELGAGGIEISLIFAAPHAAGVLRLFTPWLIEGAGDRRRLCLAAYGASGLLLFSLPAMATPGLFFDRPAALATLIWIWCIYHLLEYIGTVSLYSWLGELAPRRLRGRFFGRRETFLLIGRIAGMLGAAGLSWAYQTLWPYDPRWFSLALPACLGAVVMTAATLPLVCMPTPGRELREETLSISQLIAPLADAAFLRFIGFGVWSAFFNGISSAAIAIYPSVVFRQPAPIMLGMQSGLRFGQAIAAPFAGTAVDSMGYRLVMIVSQLLISLGPLGFFLASREAPWWIAAAFVFWIGFVGHNVAQPAYMLALAPRGQSSAYLATHYALGGVAVALSMVGGGVLHDYLGQLVKANGPWLIAGYRLDHFALEFFAAVVLRATAIVWLLFLVEPEKGRESSVG